MRAYVFRFAPESGHRAMQSACRFVPTTEVDAFLLFDQLAVLARRSSRKQPPACLPTLYIITTIRLANVAARLAVLARLRDELGFLDFANVIALEYMQRGMIS